MARRANGRAGAGTIRRMPIRTCTVRLEGDYSDFSLEMRANPPLRVFTEMQTQSDFLTLRNLMRELIVDWDFVDHEGQPIPVGELEQLPIDLFGMIVTRYLAAIAETTAVPKD